MTSDESVLEASTLVDILRWRALCQPDRLAYAFLVDGETEEIHLTYDELDRQARAIGAWLQDIGAHGERVLLLYPSGLEFVAAFFGCLYAGAIAVPAYPPHPARLERTLPRSQAIARDAQPFISLTTSTILAAVDSLFAQAPAFQATRWLATDFLSSVPAAEWREPEANSNTLALLQYTSGSTAVPKGVMVTHGNLLNNERMIQRAFGTTGQTTIGVGWLPVYHDMGLIGNVLHPLYIGFPCFLMSPLDFLQRPFRWLQAISRYKATLSGGPNFAYDLCVRTVTSEQRSTLDLSSWNLAFNGAEPIHPATLDRFATTFEPCGFRREALYPCYGLAEASLFVSGSHVTEPLLVRHAEEQALANNEVVAASLCEGVGLGTQRLVSCGHASLDQKLVIVDPETLIKCSPNRVGEIWVSGPNVTRGYWNRPEETKRTFRAYLADTGEGPFLRTGDLGFMEGGALFVTGRLKDLIIIRGQNHYPQDIEWTVLDSHSAMRPGGCAAFSFAFDDEERLAIVAEVKRDYRNSDVDQIVKTIRQAVAEHYHLGVHAILLVTIGSIPKSSNGKIQRYACRAAFLAGKLDVLFGVINHRPVTSCGDISSLLLGQTGATL